jgi:ElaB/YqjD/DUF883 family membrane-anchored ribosome-binding protein
VADDPNAIRENIAETRERMSHTLEEIGERLNPQVLKENVKDSIREATIGRVSTMARNAADSVSRTTSGVTSTMRDNPIPLAMVAVGIGWMIWNSRAAQSNGYASTGMSRTDDDAFGATDIGYGDDYGAGYTGAFDANSAEGAVDRVRDKARELGDSASRRAGELKDAASRRAGALADRARDSAGAVKQRAQQVAGSVADTTRRSAAKVEDTFYDNPLAMGAVALAVGLAAGLAAPVTDREVRLMGSTRDDFVDRVKDVAEDTKEKAQRVVSHVVNETKAAAREEGLTGPA